MLTAVLVIVSFLLFICLLNTAILLLLSSALVQFIEKSKALPANNERPVREPEKPWYAEM